MNAVQPGRPTEQHGSNDDAQEESRPGGIYFSRGSALYIPGGASFLPLRHFSFCPFCWT